MAERIVSPGVFTQERDLSFLPEGIASIGAAFVGPTTKGPAFIPTAVQGINDFVTKFGEPDGASYMSYAVKNYLQEAGSATVVRVLGTSGYTTKVAHLYATGSTGKKLYAIVHPATNALTTGIESAIVAGTTSSFTFKITATGTTEFSSSISLDFSNASYLPGLLGVDPQGKTVYPGYVYAIFPDAIAQAGAFGSAPHFVAETASLAVGPTYSSATTPWITAQDKTSKLFRVHTLSDGTSANKEIKLSIVGISPSNDPDSDFGSFTLQVRDINDSDTQPNVFEQYDNLNLDPDSANYIARRIGNSGPTTDTVTGETYYDGEYPNLSKYIWVEMYTQQPFPDTSVPYGFTKLNTIMSSSAGEVTSGSFVTSRWLSGSVPGYKTTAVDKRYYYGYNFSDVTSVQYLAPVPPFTSGSIEEGVGSTAFNIADLPPEVPVTAAPFSRSISITSGSDVGYRRFSVPFQGGFDGLIPSRKIAMGNDILPSNSQGFNLTNATSEGSIAYKKALDSLSNPDNIDLNLLVIPGVIYSQHSYVAQSAIDLCEQRGDCFYLMDLTTWNANISDAVNAASQLDTNYAASYYPWVRVVDTNTNKLMWAPPSVVLPEVYAYSDNVGAEWFAPAGLNRGGIPGAVGVKNRLSQSERDELYEGKVNPIAQFPAEGICVWGQKTLQRRASALDRVNVRRLLITVKKFIASSARYLVFEQNTEATRNRFLNIVNPYLAGIQQRSGLTAFRVVMDETNNTPDVIDRNILQGAIYLQPTRTAEFIKLDFNILPTGATFDTI